MSRSRPHSPLRALLTLAWQQPLWAIPFALFFGTIFSSGARGYLLAYQIALVFAYAIGLSVWALEHFVMAARRGGPNEPRRIPLWAEITGFVLTSIVGSFAGALIVHLTFLPGFLGNSRQVVIVGMFAIVFGLLGTGIIYAFIFYQKSLDRARSDQELVMARRIQRSFLLSQFPTMPRIEVHAVNVSSKEVSGDFYDVVPAGDDTFLIAIADVAGKGVPAALMSSMLQASLRTQANTVASVATMLRNMNTLVYRSTSVHQFATFFLASVDEPTLRLSYSNAGHNHPLVFRRGGASIPLARGGTVVGILESAEFEEGALQLEPGDRVVLYTDGISEAANRAGELYGEERLCLHVQSLPGELTAREVIESILGSVHGFLDGEVPGDDMTLLVLRVLDRPEPPVDPSRRPATV